MEVIVPTLGVSKLLKNSTRSSAGYSWPLPTPTTLSPLQPVGMTRSALAIDREKKRVYIARSDANGLPVGTDSDHHPVIAVHADVGILIEIVVEYVVSSQLVEIWRERRSLRGGHPSPSVAARTPHRRQGSAPAMQHAREYCG